MERSHEGSETGVMTKQGPPAQLWLGLHLNGWAAVRAGLGAGTVFLVLELFTGFVFGTGTPFGPAYVTLHGLAGAENLPHQYDPGLVLAALFVHFLLSVLVTLPLAVFLHPWKKPYLVAAVGFVYGVALYFLNFVVFALALPLLAGARDVFMLADYAVFGVLAAWRYITLRDRAAQAAWHRDQ